MAVEISDVRTSLNEIDASQIPDAVITQGLEYAKLELENGQTVSQEDYDYAVTMWAAHYAFNASPPQTQKSAIDLSAQWDVESYVQHLADRRDNAQERIGEGSGGTSAAIFDSVDGGVL